MELWERDAIDLVGPAFFEVGPGDQGSFRFIAVEGWMDAAILTGIREKLIEALESDT